MPSPASSSRAAPPAARPRWSSSTQTIRTSIDFIDSKANEEKKAWALIEQGYDASFTGEAYGSVFFQNANH